MMNHTANPWRPRFVFGVGGDVTDWALVLPVRPWDRNTPTAGGSRTAAGGVPAAYVVRRDHNLRLRLRLLESEMGDLDDFLAWGQAAETFLWYPSANDDSASHLVWLESPKAGEDVQPIRSAEYPRTFELDIVLRPNTPAPWILEYFPEC